MKQIKVKQNVNALDARNGNLIGNSSSKGKGKGKTKAPVVPVCPEGWMMVRTCSWCGGKHLDASCPRALRSKPPSTTTTT
eukprot:3909205-Heterocapsa_arctica.AAC.1